MGLITKLTTISEINRDKIGSKIKFHKIFRQNNQVLAKDLGVIPATILFWKQNRKNKSRSSRIIRKNESPRGILSEEEITHFLKTKKEKLKRYTQNDLLTIHKNKYIEEFYARTKRVY